MVTATVSIDSFKKIEEFVHIINKYNGRFELISGCSCVNAKSVMGIFALDISHPLCLNIYNDEIAPCVADDIEPFTL
ncbi:MAG: HPr family phosphocarrier protein [Clostridiales bacterium]|nr:HPr family phosphocarrier protein [Clostridiales bacterium]